MIELKYSLTFDEFPTLREMQWKLIDEAMKVTGHSIPKSADLLGMGRTTLYRKLEERRGSNGHRRDRD